MIFRWYCPTGTEALVTYFIENIIFEDGISFERKENKVFKLKDKKYNHLLRVALNKKIISISLRKRIKPKLSFDLKLVNLKREKPQYKNLKYKKILSYLSKMDNSKSDIGLVSNKKILESGTSNLLFVKK